MDSRGVSAVGAGFHSSTWKGITYGLSLSGKGIQWEPSTATGVVPRWMPSSKGVFTTKSAYKLLLDPTSIDQNFNWKCLWQFTGPTRQSLLLWTLAHDRLKTSQLLWRRQIIDSPRCDICGATEETTLHAV